MILLKTKIIKLIEKIQNHNPCKNDEEQQRLEQTRSESITLTQLTLQEKLELKIGKNKKRH